MLTGDSTQRNSDDLGKKMQQCYRCYTEENFGGSRFSPCMDPDLDTDYFPKQPCVGGIRSNIIFPLYEVHDKFCRKRGEYADKGLPVAGTEKTSTHQTTGTTLLILLAGRPRSRLSAASALAAIP